MRSYNPPVQAPRFGLFRFRSPLLSESRLIYFPPGTEMVHFPGLTRTRLWIQRAVSRVHRHGFPHSEIPGSKLACSSPRLIAACHVLRRLLAPRHPPYALSSLTIKLTQHVSTREDQDPGKIRSEESCSPSREFFRVSCAAFRRKQVRGTRILCAWISSPFHLRYSSKTCGYCASRT